MAKREPKGTALVKRRQNYLRLIGVFPEREEFYRAQIEEAEEKLRSMSACRRCGRPLKNETARARGYGDECLAKAEAETE